MSRFLWLILLGAGLVLLGGCPDSTDDDATDDDAGDDDTSDDDTSDDDVVDDDSGDDDTAGPVIASLEETWGPPWAPVRILGNGLGTGGTVTFGGVEADHIAFWTDTEVAVLVPPGASSGDLILTTPAGADQASFEVTARTTYFVAGGGDDGGAGTFDAPFETIGHGMDAAGVGDWVVVRGGTYAEELDAGTGGGGSDPERVVLAGYPGEDPVVDGDGRVLTVAATWVTVKDLELDGNLGGSDAVRTEDADHLILRRLHVHDGGSSTVDGGGDCIDIEGGTDLVVEDCEIHDCLAGSWDVQKDSHGIVLGRFEGATIRGCTIYRCSGDSIQADPDYDDWDDLLIEGCHLYIDPLPADKGAWLAGQIPGENALDTKADGDSADHGFVIRDCEIHGFRTGWIGNQAALNIKKSVHGVVERCTIYDNELALRMRAPASPVVVRNCVIFDNDHALRYEDGIEDLTWLNDTVVDSGEHFKDGGGGGLGGGFEVRNVLFSGAVPGEATGFASNLAFGPADEATTFEDAPGRDYHLVAGAVPVDAGEDLSGDVDDDLDGTPRPQGAGYDVGAYEYLP